MSLYIPTNSLSKFLTSTEYKEESNTISNYLEPLHLSTKYTDSKEIYLKLTKKNEQNTKEHHSKISRPPY